MDADPHPVPAPDAFPVVLFDGVCNLCNASVTFLIDHDRSGRLRFASLQSEAGTAIAARAGIDTGHLDTLVLVEGDRAHVRSSGALRLTRYMGFPWSSMLVLLVIPAFIRDVVYRFVARNRYRWFGRAESCRMPSDDLARRFLG